MNVRHTYLVVVALGLLAGCSQTPARIAAPDWDPDDFADAILAKLDTNGDGAVDQVEVAAAPGLAFGARFIDTDKNGSLSRDELVARFTKYRDMRLGITSKSMRLSYKGRPLVGAKVQFVPEFFLADVIEPASGETFDDGAVAAFIAGSDPPGMRAGYYRVVVESPRVKIPARYASADTTTLGVEVSPASDDPSTYGTIQLVLKD